MTKWPFSPLVLVLSFSGMTVILLPAGLMLGYTWLAMVGLYLTVNRIRGRLPDAAQVCTTWFCWLGIVICLHGIMISSFVALGEGPVPVAELQFGKRVAKAGGAIAVVFAVLSCVITFRNRKRRSEPTQT